jgi:hypothetical protein
MRAPSNVNTTARDAARTHRKLDPTLIKLVRSRVGVDGLEGVAQVIGEGISGEGVVADANGD